MSCGNDILFGEQGVTTNAFLLWLAKNKGALSARVSDTTLIMVLEVKVENKSISICEHFSVDTSPSLALLKMIHEIEEIFQSKENKDDLSSLPLLTPKSKSSSGKV